MSDEEVQVKFGAETSGFNAASDQVKDKLNELGDSTPDVADKFVELGKKIIEAFAVEKIVEAIDKMAEFGEQVERTAKMTGLSTDAVQEFQYAVAMTGGDAETAGQSLLRFETNLAKAQAGTGPAVEAYQKLGIRLTDLNGNAKTAQQVMAEVADKFSEAADGATKVEYAVALGSRGFAQMIPVLDEGSNGLQVLNEKLEALHGRQSPETVKALSDLAHSITDLSTAWKGLEEGVVADFEPAIKKVVELITGLISKFHEAVDAGAQFWNVMLHPPGWSGGGAAPDEGMADYIEQVLGSEESVKKTLPPLGGAAANTSSAVSEKDYDQENIAAYKAMIDEQEQEAKGHYDQQIALQSELVQAMANLYGDDSQQYYQALQKKVELQQAANKQAEADSNKFFKSIETAADQMVNGILLGTQTWQQGMARLFDNLLIKFIDDFVVKAVLQWAEGEATKLGITQAFNATMIALGLESAATDEAGQHAIRAAANTATVTSDAALTFAGVMANLSPVLGPAAAGPAGESEALVLAQIPQASLAVGTDYIPNDGLYELHQGEQIVPAAFTGAGLGSNVNVTFQIQAIDTQSGTQFLRNNASTIAAVVSTSIRNANPSLANLKSA